MNLADIFHHRDITQMIAILHLLFCKVDSIDQRSSVKGNYSLERCLTLSQTSPGFYVSAVRAF